MAEQSPYQPMRIRLEGERREHLGETLGRFWAEAFDASISPFQANQLIDFFVRELGAVVYNQAIRDAHKFMTEKLSDLEGEFFEPENSR